MKDYTKTEGTNKECTLIGVRGDGKTKIFPFPKEGIPSAL